MWLLIEKGKTRGLGNWFKWQFQSPCKFHFPLEHNWGVHLHSITSETLFFWAFICIVPIWQLSPVRLLRFSREFIFSSLTAPSSRVSETRCCCVSSLIGFNYHAAISSDVSAVTDRAFVLLFSSLFGRNCSSFLSLFLFALPYFHFVSVSFVSFIQSSLYFFTSKTFYNIFALHNNKVTREKV